MFKQYVKNEQFNLQINRFINDEYENDQKVQEDLKSIIPQLKDEESWFKAWNDKAIAREQDGDFSVASTYYQASEFYLSPEDPRDENAYRKYRENFYKGFNNFEYERYQVPYENGYLPVVKLVTPNATKNLLLFAGYDSYMEEMVKMSKFLKGIDYNIYVFDGPGQGTALRQGIHLIHNWENPVSVILDYFNLKRASAVGMSLGGYLVMRAAAFEKRLDKVVAFDIFYSFFDALRIRMPYDQKFQKYNMEPIMPLINQDVLLLAGENDQYVPSSRLVEIDSKLINAASVKSIMFDKASGGDQHCQAGNRQLGFDAIKEFLSNK